MSASSPRSVEELLQAISDGTILEHLKNNVELKSSWKQEHGHKVSAFANKLDVQRAWLVLGVGDDGVLCGRDQNWAKQTEEIVSQQFNEKLDPFQSCRFIHTRDVNGSVILIVELQNPGDVVYWGAEAYGASGTTISKLDPHQILELRLKLPGLTDFTRQPTESEYSDELVDLFAHRVRSKGHVLEQGDASAILRSLGLVRTQAARILFGDCGFRVVKYNAAGEPTSNEPRKSLYSLLTDVFHQEIQSWTAEQIGKTFRAYPQRALQEAFANAVAHAAYFEQDGDLIVELHPTYLVISNLCLKESRYFANRWFSRSHKTVNAFLMELLRVAGHVDELGRGKNLIFSQSISQGKPPPSVKVQGAGRYYRWALTLSGHIADRRQLRVFNGIKKIYGDTPKALIAQALVLWSSKQVREIRDYVDDTYTDLFAEVLSDLNGPIFYYQEEDRVVLHRWVRVMLEEGKDAKQLSPSEEIRERAFLTQYCVKYQDGYITPKLLRRLTHLGDNSSAKSYASRLLKKWSTAGHVTRVRSGLYEFAPEETRLQQDLGQLLKELLSTEKADQGAEGGAATRAP
jgi:predicted HTH transcriptional regulator